MTIRCCSNCGTLGKTILILITLLLTLNRCQQSEEVTYPQQKIVKWSNKANKLCLDFFSPSTHLNFFFVNCDDVVNPLTIDKNMLIYQSNYCIKIISNGWGRPETWSSDSENVACSQFTFPNNGHIEYLTTGGQLLVLSEFKYKYWGADTIGRFKNDSDKFIKFEQICSLDETKTQTTRSGNSPNICKKNCPGITNYSEKNIQTITYGILQGGITGRTLDENQPIKGNYMDIQVTCKPNTILSKGFNGDITCQNNGVLTKTSDFCVQLCSSIDNFNSYLISAIDYNNGSIRIDINENDKISPNYDDIQITCIDNAIIRNNGGNNIKCIDGAISPNIDSVCLKGCYSIGNFNDKLIKSISYTDIDSINKNLLENENILERYESIIVTCIQNAGIKNGGNSKISCTEETISPNIEGICVCKTGFSKAKESMSSQSDDRYICKKDCENPIKYSDMFIKNIVYKENGKGDFLQLKEGSTIKGNYYPVRAICKKESIYTKGFNGEIFCQTNGQLSKTNDFCFESRGYKVIGYYWMAVLMVLFISLLL